MPYLKPDINFNLIFLVVVVIIGTVLLTLYYTHSLGNVNVDYDALNDKFENAMANLTQTTKNLEMCHETKSNLSTEMNETKKIEEKSREEFNKIYEETEAELTETEKILKASQDDLTKTKDTLSVTSQELSIKKVALDKANEEIEDLEKEKDEYKENYEELRDDVKHCQQDDPTVACFSAIDT